MRGGELRFAYDDAWRRMPGALPLSLSMPVARAEHGHDVTDAFLRGLLPDNVQILEAWSRRFGVSARNAFALLAHVGEDCAGAVQFVDDARLGAVLADDAWEVEWLDERGVEQRLDALEADRSAWRMARDTGQFSLAGSQPKTALLLQDGRWGVPAGRAPTTHILKPPIPGYDGHVENEHLCLGIARELGLPVARSEVRRFGARVAIVIERFDRASAAALATTARMRAAADALAGIARSQPILRLHQEDACQALGLPPTAKYQSDGGPAPADIVALLRSHSSRPVEDTWTFVTALALNWLVAGTDAHAKNYALLHGGHGQVRLAPLYDLASALPYDDIDPRRATLAMKIGGKYRVRDIAKHQWEKLAAELQLDSREVIERIADLAQRLPAAAAAVTGRALSEGLTHPLVKRLTERVTARAAECARALASG